MMTTLRALAENEAELAEMKLYEDEHCIAILASKPFSLCHIVLFPRTHATILEQLPDALIQHLFHVSNKLSQVLFESLNIQGTNILIQNGVPAGQDDPQISIHIIARTENDGIKLDWEPKKISEEEMSIAELQYQKAAEEMTHETEQPPPEKSEAAKPEEISDEEEENYLIKYFERKA